MENDSRERDMVGRIKSAVRDKLNSACYRKYVLETERQKDSYRQWYLGHEDWKRKRTASRLRCGLIFMQEFVWGVQVPEEDVILFADQRGELEEKAAGVTAGFFERYPYVQLACADEDCVDRSGRRHSPWFKPCWSPDTLDSFQYFGHVFAVRGRLLRGLSEREWEECTRDDFEKNVYRLLLLLSDKITRRENGGNPVPACGGEKPIASLGKVLFHRFREMGEPDDDLTAEELFADGRRDTDTKKQALPQSVSVIIPSRDNPQVLETCVRSIREKTVLSVEAGGKKTEIGCEILVVDNGSSPENRVLLEKLASKYEFAYYYRPQPFNFSVICNYGASQASGDFLLFLNDDMEIIQKDWMVRMLEKASLAHAGAVGAKLLYPGSDMIQHIGITNIKVGPVHKLLKQHDQNEYYHGQNRHIYDMIGVTAACLMVEKRKFMEVDGLFEGMAVAYNDVDFCFKLYEKGYYNIQRNDVSLYHHESLSRGDDNLSDEKWVRLLKEKELLYERHPGLKGKDPFYSENLAAHSNLYLSNFMYEFEKRDYYTKVRRWRKEPPVRWKNDCLTVNVEHAREEKKLEFTELDDVYWIEGWSYVLGMDNCRYQRKLLLEGSQGTCYAAAVLDRYREDVADILPEQSNVELSGFVCRIQKGVLPPDEYTVSMIARDRCSAQRLYRRTEKKLDTREHSGKSDR